MIVKIKKLSKNAIIPTHGSDSAAGWDLYALPDNDPIYIDNEESVIIHTGISVEIPEGYFGAIYARSGIAARKGLRPANCVGIIDSDYRGEIMVCLRNDTANSGIKVVDLSPGVSTVEVVPNEPAYHTVMPGDRVAQLIIQKYEPIEFEEVEELDETARGEGGFGSTGTD